MTGEPESAADPAKELSFVASGVDTRSGTTSFIAANLIVEFLAQICDRPGWRGRLADRSDGTAV